ncbi:MAG TPA: glycosyltransferase family 39 protein [Terriglobales bacterium]
MRSFFWLAAAGALLLTLANAAGQFVIFRPYLNDEVINAYAPTAADAAGYVTRAKGIAMGESFDILFRDGRRLPGYPFFLSVFMRYFSQALFAARLAQIALSASTIFISFLIIRKVTNRPDAAILTATLVAFCIPLYYFSPMLYAETCSIFVLSLLLYVIANIDQQRYIVPAVLCGILVAVLTYLKPNHVTQVLLAVSAALVVLPRWRRSILFASVLIMTTLVLLFPWLVFMRNQSGQMVPPLSSFQGEDLYIGAGYELPTGPMIGDSLYYKFGLYDPVEAAKYAAEAESLNPMEESRYYQRLALQRWRTRPLQLSALGLCRVLHCFGFSLRHYYDYTIALFTIASLIASLMLWHWRKYRQWAAVFWTASLLYAVQTFFFLAEIRFKVVVVDLPALFVCGLFCFECVQRFKVTPTFRPTN